MERKTKKKIGGRKRDRENEEKITNIDIDLLVISDVIILLMKKKKWKEKQLHFTVNYQVSQNP